MQSERLFGLTRAEAAARLREEGPNLLSEGAHRSAFATLGDILREPMLLLLFCCALVYFFVGGWHEAALLLGSAVFVVGLSFIQQWKSDRAVERLREFANPRAVVIRDGAQMRIAGPEIVRGDLLVVAEGERVPADAEILSTDHLEIDESLLTGESLPVRKSVADKCYAGTLAVSGGGYARVIATGARSQLGTIGKSLSQVKQSETRFQQEAKVVVKALGFVAIAFCILVAFVYGWKAGNWPQALLAGLATAMSMLPEELPVVLTLFLVLGAWRISKRSVLTRRMTAIETLGTTTVLCVDKTGTLTQNRMELETIWLPGVGEIARREFGARGQGSSAEVDRLLTHARLANRAVTSDPMEKAIEAVASIGSTEPGRRLKEYPLSNRLLAMSCVWRLQRNSTLVVAAKGAPEAIAELCKLPQREAVRVAHATESMAKRGQRVLGVASAEWEGELLPPEQTAFQFRFMGLVAFEDPIRPEVSAAVKECYTAGIRVVMMTGDYAGTASAIAHQIGLNGAEKVVTGQALSSLDGAALDRVIAETQVFARLKPEHKLTLVRALKVRGEIVTMTGDGVNDAPSLKASDIGIAMGARGTDVAREASDLVLLDDNFASIVGAVRLGRRIFENIRDAVSYILAIHVPIAGMALLPAFFGMPLILLPPQIVFLEFIIDPACSFVFEAEQEDPRIMCRPPRRPGDRLFSWDQVLWSFLQGLTVLLLTMAVYRNALTAPGAEAHARSLAFTTLIFGNLALIFANRSGTASLCDLIRQPNKAFRWVFGLAVGTLVAILQVPSLRTFFLFGHLDAIDLVFSMGVGFLCVLVVQAMKYLRFSFRRVI